MCPQVSYSKSSYRMCLLSSDCGWEHLLSVSRLPISRHRGAERDAVNAQGMACRWSRRSDTLGTSSWS
eukprot:891630-Pyramimonas_sp.AAC.1